MVDIQAEQALSATPAANPAQQPKAQFLAPSLIRGAVTESPTPLPQLGQTVFSAMCSAFALIQHGDGYP